MSLRGGLHDYQNWNYCLTCKLRYEKTTLRCQECNRRVRTKPQYNMGQRNHNRIWKPIPVLSATVTMVGRLAPGAIVNVMAYVNYDKERFCSRCGEKRSIVLIFCNFCGCRLRYKRRMTHSVARAARLRRNKLWPILARINSVLIMVNSAGTAATTVGRR